ncbi:MAG: hypothetical protein A2498_00290 [Lentisphaerae bacterium RIFOXYC12_FULL_60_16]|nr:MAG: hypothetical protein A2498_00290 [Lentisphaerae bacterium RIFOXYC12_FULL_60_16]
MIFRQTGITGPTLPVLTLGLMVRDCRPGAPYDSVRKTVLAAVEAGITSVDLATGYGGGAVETAFGAILRQDLSRHRSTLFLATKAGWGDGSPRTLSDSLDRSLRQLGVDHVDLYYHHAPDANTPFEVTADALASLVRQGKTRYVGLSNYSTEQTIRMAGLLHATGAPCILHQANYNPLNRWVEDSLLKTLPGFNMGMAVFSALNQGLLSNRSIPTPRAGSRAEKAWQALVSGVQTGEPAYGRYPAGADVREHILRMLSRLRAIADGRGQTLEQMVLAWILRHPQVTTVLVGLSEPEQVPAVAGALNQPAFTADELRQIESILPPR